MTLIDPFEVRFVDGLEKALGNRAEEVQGEVRSLLRKLYAHAFTEGRALGAQEDTTSINSFITGYKLGQEDQKANRVQDPRKLATQILSTLDFSVFQG